MSKSKTFSIIGYGRFGALMAKYLSEHVPVVVYSRKTMHIDTIEKNIHVVSLEQALNADFIFLTIPIRSFPAWMEENAKLINPNSVLLDCASVKTKVIEWITPYQEQYAFDYIATHPLYGPDSAREGLKKHKIVIIPQKVSYPKLNYFKQFLEEKLQLQILRMSPEEHDLMMAYNLSLVHLIGRALGNMKIENLPLKMNNLDGILKIARIASNDTEELFIDMNKYNPYARQIRQMFLKNLDELVQRYLE